MDRRSFIRTAGVGSLAPLALAAVGSIDDAAAATLKHGVSCACGRDHRPTPNPAVTPVPNPPYPRQLTACEREHLQTFDELDFVVFSHAEWSRIGESHASTIRVHMPDGSFTDGLNAHIATLRALFTWAPDTRIDEHPIRVAKDDLTAVTGVMRGTFTQPMHQPDGTTVAPTGKAYAINMVTVGAWNRRGVMHEEWLFWDNLSFFQQIGLA